MLIIMEYQILDVVLWIAILPHHFGFNTRQYSYYFGLLLSAWNCCELLYPNSSKWIDKEIPSCMSGVYSSLFIWVQKKLFCSTASVQFSWRHSNLKAVCCGSLVNDHISPYIYHYIWGIYDLWGTYIPHIIYGGYMIIGLVATNLYFDIDYICYIIANVNPFRSQILALPKRLKVEHGLCVGLLNI